MQLIVLGRWSPYPAPGGACPSYLVQEGPTRLMLDCGPGAVARLRQHCEAHDLSALVLSHLHVDHILSIYPLRDAYEWQRADPERPPLPVYAPDDAAELLVGILRGSESVARFRRTFAFHPITETSVESVGPLRLTFARTEHPVYCLAVRIECAGRTLVYSADSSPTAALEALARGANLLLCEATFPDSHAALAAQVGHMTATQAAELASRAGVERLVLTHFSPQFDPEEQRRAAAKILHTRALIAEENARYPI
jgi:ribonuclease BN (tRNA processing enzyme)